MKKNKFFDVIIISLILMTSFKMLYPDAFTVNVTVNSFLNSSDNQDLQMYQSLDEFVSEFVEPSYFDYVRFDDYYGTTLAGEYIWSNVSSLELCSLELAKCYTVNSISPCFYIDGELWYFYDLSGTFSQWFSGYDINTDCDWVCSSAYI